MVWWCCAVAHLRRNIGDRRPHCIYASLYDPRAHSGPFIRSFKSNAPLAVRAFRDTRTRTSLFGNEQLKTSPQIFTTGSTFPCCRVFDQFFPVARLVIAFRRIVFDIWGQFSGCLQGLTRLISQAIFRVRWPLSRTVGFVGDGWTIDNAQLSAAMVAPN